MIYSPEQNAIFDAGLANNTSMMITAYALTGYVTIPRENELDFLAEAEAMFVPPPPAKKKPKANKPTLIKGSPKASPKAAPKQAATPKKRVAA